jgi:hypothetical protein
MANASNRLDSQFSLVGAFWAPDAPEDIRTGTLVADGGSITFTTAPEYIRGENASRPSQWFFGQNEPERLPILYGITQDGVCTLFDLVVVDRPGRHELGLSITAIVYRAAMCISGMHLTSSQDKCVNSARYTFTGLGEWLPKAITETWGNENIVLTVPLKERDILAFSLRGTHVQVSLKVFPQLTSSDTDDGRVSRSIPLIEIEVPSAECLSWYLEVGNRLENLFSLLTGSSLALETVFVYRGEESGHLHVKSSKRVRPFDPRDCVFPTHDQLANSIAVWLSESREFRSVDSLALGIIRKGKLFMETEFLSLAQALEGVHRVTTQTKTPDRTTLRQVRRKITALLKAEKVDPALAERICTSLSYANEPTFASRLKEICQRVSGPLLNRMEIDPEEFASNIVATRNFYTHAGSTQAQKRRKPVSGFDLFLLNKKMQSILRAALLLHLGIPEAQFERVLVREATRWR